MRHIKGYVLSILIFPVVMFHSCGFIEGIIPPDKDPFGRSRGNIAFIVETNNQNGVDYQYFLEENNYLTKIIDIDAVVNTDFSDYGLIIIDSDSGSDLTWGTHQIVDILKESNRPIIGLGRGGARFFQNVEISINFENSDTYKKDVSIYVVDTTHPVFNSPETVEISPILNSIQICSDPDTDTTGIRENSTIHSATRLGYSIDKRTHSPLIQEGRFLLWGYNNTPLSMTNNGKKLFFNIVYYLIKNY